MEFLREQAKKKIIRTTLYGDQEFRRSEWRILHTPVVQRLYNLKQLGFTDRVYPDAVHSRFNHVLGATEMAERMAHRLLAWLARHGTTQFAYSIPVSNKLEERQITGQELESLLLKSIPVVRLVALLHDLTHAAFGHTLEDEVCLFPESHDSRLRQQRFFDGLVAQLVYIWLIELGIREADVEILDALGRLDVDQAAVLGGATKSEQR